MFFEKAYSFNSVSDCGTVYHLLASIRSYKRFIKFLINCISSVLVIGIPSIKKGVAKNVW